MKSTRSRRPLIAAAALAAGIGAAAIGVTRPSLGWYVAGLAVAAIAVVLLAALIAPRRVVIALVIVAAAGVGAGLVIPAVAASRAERQSDDVVAALDVTMARAWPYNDGAIIRTDTQRLSILSADGSRAVDLGVQAGELYVGNGPVLVIHVADEITAFGVDGTRFWEREQDENTETPVAAFSDGTVVLRSCPRDTSDAPPCRLVAVEQSGAERWNIEAGDVSLVADTGSSEPVFDQAVFLPHRLVGIERPASDLDPATADVVDEPVIQFDAMTGSRRVLTTGVSAAVVNGQFGDDWIVVSSTSGGQCRLYSFNAIDSQDPVVGGPEVPCLVADGIVSRGPFAYVIAIDSTTALDPSTGQFVVYPSDVTPTEAGLSELTDDGGTRVGLDRYGGEQFVVDRTWKVESIGRQTIVVSRPVRTHNPFQSADMFDVAVLDIDSGERCAQIRVTGAFEAAALSKCRALVSVGDETYVVRGR